jgi:hypothetical protein
MSKIHAGHMEVAVAELIGYRTHVIVPNVSWGLGLEHECDLLILDGKGRFTEVEIKISKSDLKADFSKSHGHKSKIISRLIYAVPEHLLEAAVELVPKTCGIIVVKTTDTKYGGIRHTAFWHRLVRHKVVELPKQHILNNFYRLGCMRIWSLKKHNNK